MNPIEKALSKLKAFLRKIAERTVAGLIRALEACPDIFKSAECTNYFAACTLYFRIDQAMYCWVERIKHN